MAEVDLDAQISKYPGQYTIDFATLAIGVGFYQSILLPPNTDKIFIEARVGDIYVSVTGVHAEAIAEPYATVLEGGVREWSLIPPKSQSTTAARILRLYLSPSRADAFAVIETG